MRVSSLANDLGVDPKDIRKFLRSEYGQVGTGGRWDLNQQQVNRVRWRFEGSGKTPRTLGATGGSNIPLIVRRQTGPDIINKVNLLRAEPQDIHIKVVGSDDLVFHRIINSWVGRGGTSTVVLLSNGEFKESKDIKDVSLWFLESQYYLIKKGERYYAHHSNYVNCLSEVTILQWLVPVLVERAASTGRDDTPQELLINDYATMLGSKLSTSIILKWEHNTGRTIQEMPLKELYDPEFKIPRGYQADYDFRLALSRYFVTINLLTEYPLRSEAFNVTLGEVFRRFHIEVGQRAENLRRDVASRLGFEQNGDNWRRRKDGDEVVISNDLRVHINHKFVCIVSAKSSQLPHDDEVARRMLTVATAHRDQICTIRGEAKEALERLFPVGVNGT